jgi:hypothetical protein
MKNRLFIGLVLFAVLMSAACCKKDPCANQTTTSADFKIFEPLDEDIRYSEISNGDTLNIGNVTFEAQDSSSDVISYEWKIGTDPRIFNKRLFSLEFSDSGQVIPVRLIVKKTVNTMCFPNDDGIDTLFKTFYLAGAGLAYGKFEGYVESNPTEKFTISTEIQPRIGYAFVSNLPNGCSRNSVDAQTLNFLIGYRSLKFGKPEVKRLSPPDEAKCQIPWGFGKVLRDNKTLILDYSIWSLSKNQFVKDRFIGIKK